MPRIHCTQADMQDTCTKNSGLAPSRRPESPGQASVHRFWLVSLRVGAGCPQGASAHLGQVSPQEASCAAGCGTTESEPAEAHELPLLGRLAVVGDEVLADAVGPG